jgi:hypothetical protein
MNPFNYFIIFNYFARPCMIPATGRSGTEHDHAHMPAVNTVTFHVRYLIIPSILNLKY